MRKKKWFIAIILILSIFFVLTACGKSSEISGGNGEVNTDGGSFVNPDTTRKIIYSASLTITGNDVSQIVEKVRALFPEDSWCDSERISGNEAHFEIRVKTANFDSFIASLKGAGTISELNKTAKDITSSYSNFLNNKLALETEQARLFELMETASLSEITNFINPRLTVIDAELRKINSQLNELDSLLEYSSITIRIYTNNTKPPENFGEQVQSVFFGAWSFVKGFFSGVVKVLVALVPISLIIIPVGGIVVFILIYNSKNVKTRRHSRRAEKLKLKESCEEKEDKK